LDGAGKQADPACGGIGPRASPPFGVTGHACPIRNLTLYSGSTQIGSNDNWGGRKRSLPPSPPFYQTSPFPAGSKDAALPEARSASGPYTASVTDVTGGLPVSRARRSLRRRFPHRPVRNRSAAREPADQPSPPGRRSATGGKYPSIAGFSRFKRQTCRKTLLIRRRRAPRSRNSPGVTGNPRQSHVFRTSTKASAVIYSNAGWGGSTTLDQRVSPR